MSSTFAFDVRYISWYILQVVKRKKENGLIWQNSAFCYEFETQRSIISINGSRNFEILNKWKRNSLLNRRLLSWSMYLRGSFCSVCNFIFHGRHLRDYSTTRRSNFWRRCKNAPGQMFSQRQGFYKYRYILLCVSVCLLRTLIITLYLTPVSFMITERWSLKAFSLHYFSEYYIPLLKLVQIIFLGINQCLFCTSIYLTLESCIWSDIKFNLWPYYTWSNSNRLLSVFCEGLAIHSILWYYDVEPYVNFMHSMSKR